jgi:hypothetical protein
MNDTVERHQADDRYARYQRLRIDWPNPRVIRLTMTNGNPTTVSRPPCIPTKENSIVISILPETLTCRNTH